MQEISNTNKNKRLEDKGKHVGGAAFDKFTSFVGDSPKLDKNGLEIIDY